MPGLGLSQILRFMVMGMLALFSFVGILLLTPASLEQVNTDEQVSQEDLITEKRPAEPTLATGIPQNKVPEYSIQKFEYVATQGTEKQWKIVARRAFMYSQEKLMHARTVVAHIYDSEGQITEITGKESKYFLDQRDLEVFGDVVTRFPDGFEVHSQYLRYRAAVKKVEIPTSYPVRGAGNPSSNDGEQRLSFDSLGLEFTLGTGQVILPKKANVQMIENPDRPAMHRTTIESDRAVIERDQQLAEFMMSERRPIDERFVKITQPTMIARSRKAELRYGKNSSELEYMILSTDVLIKETRGTLMRYATSGRAEFDSTRDVIVLKEFPQVYQDSDTVAGEIITVHRETDIVEVEHSNAYSNGEKRAGP